MPTPTPTTGLTDFDLDGIPDHLESRRPGISGRTNWMLPDSDNDGLLDGEEDHNHNGIVDYGETDPRRADSDDDGYTDGLEIELLESDPLDENDPGPGLDHDYDGLPIPFDTNDFNADQDNDRYTDGYEAQMEHVLYKRTSLHIHYLGDVNGDGRLTQEDANLVNEIWLDHNQPVLANTSPADVNGDGWINGLDALLIQGFLSGKVRYLPAE